MVGRLHLISILYLFGFEIAGSFVYGSDIRSLKKEVDNKAIGVRLNLQNFHSVLESLKGIRLNEF